VLLCYGNVVGVGRGHREPPYDWGNDGVIGGATDAHDILTMGKEEDEKQIVRRLRSLASRRRVEEDESEESNATNVTSTDVNNNNSSNSANVNDDENIDSEGDGGDDDDDGGYYYGNGYYGASTDAVPEYICQEIYNSSRSLPLNVSSTRVIRRNSTIGALARHNSPILPEPISNVCGNQYHPYYDGVFAHWYRVRWANSSLLFEDDTDICYNVTVASFPAASSEQTYEPDVLVQVYQGSLISNCASSLSCLAGNYNNSIPSRSVLLSLSASSILPSENMDNDVWIVVRSGGYIRSLPYELYVTVR
jgi:hypothetical protein